MPCHRLGANGNLRQPVQRPRRILVPALKGGIPLIQQRSMVNPRGMPGELQGAIGMDFPLLVPMQQQRIAVPFAGFHARKPIPVPFPQGQQHMSMEMPVVAFTGSCKVRSATIPRATNSSVTKPRMSVSRSPGVSSCGRETLISRASWASRRFSIFSTWFQRVPGCQATSLLPSAARFPDEPRRAWRDSQKPGPAAGPPDARQPDRRLRPPRNGVGRQIHAK